MFDLNLVLITFIDLQFGLIIAICGACRVDDLIKVTIDDVSDKSGQIGQDFRLLKERSAHIIALIALLYTARPRLPNL